MSYFQINPMTKIFTFLAFSVCLGCSRISWTKGLTVVCFILFAGFTSQAQEYNTFEVRYQNNLKGDLTFISNNILNRDGGTATTEPNNAYNNLNTNNRNNNPETGGRQNYNDFKNMQYINVDPGGSRFNSSTANLEFPDTDCNLIRYAGLYWSATYPSATANGSYDGSNYTANTIPVGRPAGAGNIDEVQLKVPGGTYVDIKADEILYDGFTSSDDTMRQNSPYACYADVTALLTPLANPTGDYTVANIQATTGALTPGGGSTGGWTLVIVYENPTLTGKLITTFDGFARVRDTDSIDIDYDGFTTIPSGPVVADIGAATLEGDFRISGDRLRMRAASDTGFTTLSNATNPANNFFNSNITLNGAFTTNRTPNSANTLGYDTDIFRLNNPTNSVIPNDETAAVFRFETAGDQYYPFFNSFNIEIIEPDMVLEKRVEDIAGNDITGQGVNLGQILDYVLSFKNIGNDDATGIETTNPDYIAGDNPQYTIKDILPINVTLDETNLTLPAGVTYDYDDSNGTVYFYIPDNLIEVDDPLSQIRMRVRVASNCFDFVDACTDLIQNVAYSTYAGVVNDNKITDDPSVSDFDDCGFVTPGATNFLLDDLSDCNFDRTVQLCGDDVTLDAGNNFDSYVWYKDENENGEIDSSDTVLDDGDSDNDPSTLVVTDIGIYIVDKIIADPCKGFKEIITVERFGTTQTNPIVDFFNERNGDADATNDIQGEIVTCSVDGDLLPKIFLCGTNDEQAIEINITDAQSLSWEKLDETSCADASDDCANKNLGCTWNEVATGNNYIADTAGKFRLVVNYTNGCFSRFYFDVFRNNLDILYNKSDIICTTDGNITITNLGSGYGYRLVDVANSTIPVPFSANNGPSFDITTNGAYRVDITQLDASGNPIPDTCIFSTPDIGILNRDFQVDVVTTPANCNALGKIKIDVLNVEPDYSYTLRRQDGTLIDDETAQPDNTHTFDVNTGDYTIEVTTADGCAYTENITVGRTLDPTISALTTKDIGCTAGTITLTGSNGFPNPDYSYAIWSRNGTNLYTDVASIPGDAYDTNPVFSFGWRDTDADDVDEYFAGEDGTYSFVIVDSNNCFAFSNEVTLNDNGVAAIDSIDETPPSCSGDSDGALIINVSGGTPPYQYSIDDGATYQDTPDFVNLTAGNYPVRVLDASGCDISQSYNLDEPFPLSASAGISRDATCDPNGAEVRITNVEGGNGTYQYSFDGGATFGSTTVAVLPPGDYTVIVTDGSCEFPIAVTVEDIPEEPEVTLTPEVSYLCDGSAVITATPDISTYDYTYYLDGVINSPDPASNEFPNVSPGTYVVSTNYISKTPPTPSILLTENFGYGDGTIQSADTSGYFYEAQTTGANPNQRTGDTDTRINDYEYAVTNRIINPYIQWVNPNDHTSPSDPTGRFLVMNVGTPSTGQIIYSKAINDVIPNQPVRISLQIFNLLNSSSTLSDPDLTIEIRETGTGTVIQSIRTGDIPKNTGADDWVEFTADLDPGNNTNLDFVIRTEKVGNNGNDFALDDIEIFQVPEVCELTVETPVTVVAGNRFSASITATSNASCSGESDASVTFEAANFDTTSGFEYSTDGGTTYTTSTTSPVTTTPTLSPGDYTFILRKKDEPSCSVSIDQTISEPTALQVDAEITTPYNCNSGGATITASATDGISPYQYQLENASGGIIRSYQNDTAFRNITEGTYIVRARDNNGCEGVTDAPIIIDTPASFTYTVEPTLCYSGANDATVTVEVTGGNGGLLFSINNSPYESPDAATPNTYVFDNLSSGSYNINVKDQRGCSFGTKNVQIRQAVTVSATASKIPACGNITTSQVRISASGGDFNFRYALVPDGVTPNASDFNTQNTRTISTGGDYDVYVRDKGGNDGYCETKYDLTVDQDEPLDLTVTSTEIQCSGSSQSTITIDLTGGNAPYRYSIDDGATYQTSNTFPNVSAGTYDVRVQDTSNCEATDIHVVSEPFTLSASALVAELIECNPTAGAEVRIVNARGGTAPYQYSFDGGATYQASNISNLFPGDYTVFVKDANDCSLAMDLTVLPAQTPPGITTDIDYFCDGEATITVNPDDPQYTYTYEIDNVLNTPEDSNVFTDVPAGDHVVTVNYVITTVTPPSTLLTEDFGFGTNTSITEIDPVYCYEPQNGTESCPAFGNDQHLQDGEYVVTKRLTNLYNSWISPNDHTGNTDGRYLAINVGGVAGDNGIVYAKRDVEVLPNQDITISLWAFNLLRDGQRGADPSFRIELVDPSGNIIATTSTGLVPKNFGADDWQNYSVDLNPGANTTLDIVFRTNSTIEDGNDISIDDLLATQPPAKCPAEVSVDVLVEAGKALSADITATNNVSCNGANDGSVTFEVENFDTTTGYEYSFDGGTTFTGPLTTSPVTITNLPAGTTDITVRDVADNTCSVTISPVISEPNTLTATAAVTSEATCLNDATIQATPTGGTPTYTYQLEDAATPTPNVLTAFQGNDSFMGVAPGSYVIRVRDANGCETTAPVTVDDPSPLTFTATPTACYSGNNDAEITMNVTAGNGTYQFSINGGPWLSPSPATDTTYTFGNLGAGSYVVNVKDAYGCDGTARTVIVESNLTVTASADPITACATATDVDITATGGDANYVYAFVTNGSTPAPGDFTTTNPLSATSAGDYDVYVRDNAGKTPFCEAVYDITILQDDPIVITPTVTDVLCNGDSTGAISLAVTGGEGPYQYQLENTSPSIITAFNPSNSFTNLPAGNDYVVRVKDANDCELTQAITISEPDPIVAEAEITKDYTCSDKGEITVGSVNATTGGSGDYQYRINGGAWSASTTGGTVFTDLEDDSYTIDVRDANANNCVVTIPTTVIIDPLPNEPNLTTSVGYNCDGSGNITVFPLDPNYTYSLDAGPEQSGNVFNDVAVGTHTITVDYGKDCTVDTTVIIETGKQLRATVATSTDVSCNGFSDGTVTLSVTNFDTTNGFEYSTDGGTTFTGPETSSPVTITGLAAGTVNIEVRDVTDNTCTITLSRAISEPTALITEASETTPYTCDNAGATITASATGGTSAYEYQLEDAGGLILTAYQTIATFTDVTEGNYIIRGRDANGCIDPIDTAINIVAPANPTFTAISTDCYSGNNDATIQVDVLSGNSNYQFSIDAGPWLTPTPSTDSTYTFENLTAGTYVINVRDGFGCPGTAQNITINPELTANAVVNPDLTCTAPATVTVNANGGFGSYSYEWSDDSGLNYSTSGFSGNVFNTTTDGTYIFRVTDSSTPAACAVVTEPVDITPADLPVITSVTPTDIFCNGDSTGNLDVVIDTGIGRPVYTINVFETISVTDYGTRTSGLPAGDYEVTITDDKGCTSNPFPVSISQPDAIVYDVNLVPITCDSSSGTQPGSITVENLTGGVAEYMYYLTGNNGYSDTYTTTSGGEDYTFAILEFGIYEVDVVDANGCSVRKTNIIASPPDDLDIDVSTTTVDCSTGGTAAVTVSSAVGSNNYEFATLETYSAPYSSSYQNSDTPGGDTATFTGLTPGVTYTFVVHDLTTDCYYFESAATPVNSPSSMTATLDAVSNVTCTGAADGNISFTFNNYDAAATDVSYEIFNAQSNVTTGFSGSSNVNPPAPSTGVSITDFATLSPGVYYILFKEVGGTYNGCSIGTPNFTISESSNLLTVAASSPKNDNCNVDAGRINARAQNGTSPYEFQYLLDTAPAPTASSTGWTTNSFANVESGDYIVYVKDDNGCIQTDTVTVALDPSPEISVSIVDECVDEGTFEAMVTLDAAGISPYLLSINGGAFQSVTFNASNEYTVTGLNSGAAQTIAIRDLNGCGEMETFTIHAPLRYTAKQTVLLDCEPGSDANAEITIEVTSGSGDYEIEIDGPGTADLAKTSLAPNPYVWTGASSAGSYIIRVSDINTSTPNCFKTVTIDVPDAAVPEFTESHIDVTCNGGSDGSITLTEVNNGVNPLTYTLTPMPAGAVLNGNTFENLPVGTYDVRGRGTNECPTDITGIVIAEPTAVSVSAATVVEFSCSTGNTYDNASIMVSGVTGGSGTFVRYEFINNQGTTATGDDVTVQNGSNNVYTEANALGGNYTINVYDDAGCTGTTTAAIDPYVALSNPTATITQNITCVPGDDAEVTLGVTLDPATATPNLLYSVQGTDNTYNAPDQTTDVFAGLSIGNYIGRIVNSDTGCFVEAPFEIKDPNTFDITIDTVDVVCFGDEGSVSFTINDAVNGYSNGFTWQIYDSKGTIDLTDDTIVSAANGTSANAGPTTPFAIEAGTYRVDITQDSDPNCTATDFFNIVGPNAVLVGTSTKTDVTCNLNDGIIEIIDAQGGYGGITYFVDVATNPAPTSATVFSTSPKFENLSGGVAGTDYQVWIRDSKGCMAQLANINLIDPTPISADLQISVPNCSNTEGVLEVAGTTGGQNSNYVYQLQRFDGTAFNNVRTAQSTTTFSNLGEGRYQVIISDQWDCTFTTPEQELFDEIMPFVTVDKAIDCDATNPGGTVTVSETGGSGSFTYAVAFPDGSTPQPTNTTGVFTDLTDIGTYTFTVTDNSVDHSCFKTITQELFPAVYPIIQIDTFENVTCIGDNDGTISVSVQDNGLTPYTFEITSATGSALTLPYAPSSTTDLSAVFTGLEGSATGITYTITATGDNSCTTTITQVITQPDAIVVATPTVVEFSCTDGNNSNSASITVDNTALTGGSGNYVRYEFVNNQGTAATGDDVTVQNGANFTYIETDRAGGSYTVNVYDDNGCLGTQTATIAPYDELLTATTAITNPISCSPGNDGEITVSVTSTDNDPSKFEYSIDNGSTYQTSNIFQNLSIGTHVFVIRHVDTGCTITASQRIADPNTFTIDIQKVNDVICFGTATGEITLALVDATYGGGFDWEIFNTNGTTTNTGDDTSVATGTETTNGPTTGINLPAGSFYVTISQSNAPTCTNTEGFTINGPTAAITGDSKKTEVTCNQNDGSIEIIDVHGGWGNYTYFVTEATDSVPTDDSGFFDSPLFANLSGGVAGTDYQVWVADSEGCIERLADVNLIDPTPISADLQVNVENCTNLEGEIEVINQAGGQGSNYSYQLQRFDTSTSTFEDLRTIQTSPIFSGLGAGEYQVILSDQWDCSGTTSASIELYEEIVPVATVVKTIDCSVDPGGQITISQTGGSGTYTYTIEFPDGSTPQPSNTTGVFTGLDQVGEYTFTLTDDRNCVQTIKRSLQPQVDPVPSIDTFTDVSCFGDANGTISVSVLDNGVGPYTFEITDKDGTAVTIAPTSSTDFSAEFTGLANTTTATGYTITATGANGCPATVTQTIEQPSAAVAVPAPATVSFGCTDGNVTDYPIIDITGVTGGSGVYVRYEFINDDNPDTAAVGDAITVQDGSNSTYTETNLTGGTYTINVYDNNGCMNSTTTTINPFVSISNPVIAIDNMVSCATNDEDITVSVTVDPATATPNLQFEMTGLNVAFNEINSDGDFDDLGVGNYSIAITNLDTGCTINTVHAIEDPDMIRVTAAKLTDEECLNDGVNGGSFQITAIDNYTGTYNYQVYDSNDNIVPGPAYMGSGDTSTPLAPFRDLLGGVYYVRITETEAPFCFDDSGVITILEPDAAVTANIEEQPRAFSVSCSNDQGRLLVDPEGGEGPYTITIDSGTQTFTETNVEAFIFSGLSAGNFNVTVTDAFGCVYAANQILERPDDIDATITATALTCFDGATASVTALVDPSRNVTSPVYQYRLNRYDDLAGTALLRFSVAGNSATFQDLSAGFYSITVSDEISCSDETAIVEITNPTEVRADLIRTNPLTCATGVEFELSATGGLSGTYEYRLLGTETWTAMTGNSVSLPQSGMLDAGIYSYEVRDAVNQCAAAASNSIEEDIILPLILNIDQSAAVINCNGDNTAIIYANATGGLGDYMFELFENSVSAANSIAGPLPKGEFKELTAGTYWVNVTSNDCTTAPIEVIITEPDALSAVDLNNFTNVTCNGANDGSITVELTGGTAPYQYAISPNLNQFSDENVFTGLEGSATGIDYTVIAQDSKGCFLVFEYTIIEPDPLRVSSTIMPEVCQGESNGSIALTITGGTAPYSTRFSDENNFVEDRTVLSDLAAGDYILFIRDAAGCEENVVVTVESGVNLNATVEAVYGCEDNVPSNYINIVLEDISVSDEVLYALDSTDPADMQLNPFFRDTLPGSHYVAISHANGCIVIHNFETESYEPLTLSVTQSNINELTATVNGGKEDYTIYFGDVNNGEDNTFMINRTDTYVVRVVDDNGCEATVNIYIEFIDIEIPNFFSPNGDAENQNWKPRNDEGFPQILTIIFDRYGREVYRMNQGDDGWDGLYNQTELPSGDYWYIIKLNGENDDREFVGHFTLYR